jgi:hypothetical protein
MSVANYKPQNVKFISYTGKYPNLCSGILTLEIRGNEHKFGYGSGQHEPFWYSGGSCGFPNGFGAEPVVSSGPWVIDASRLDDDLKTFAHEIDEVFNDNVPFGCCGGCI